MHRLLLWLWRWLPMGTRLRWFVERTLVANHQLGACLIAFDEAGRVLLAHHTYRHQFAWSLPAGWIEHAEDPAAAATRELREETGLVARDVKLVAARRSRGRPSALTLVYAARVDGGTFRPSAEVDQIRWVEVEELPPEILSRYGDWIRAAAPTSS
jgi:ADP-ribose pyrophosphatase YjhB (NUDIX family)